VSALRWSPNELAIAQEPGTVETYPLLLMNETEAPAEVRVFVSDWLRDEQGFNDLSVPLNGARWIFDRTFSAGESLQIKYAVELPAEVVDVSGTFRTWSPQVAAEIAGGSRLEPSGETAVPEGGMVTVTREIAIAQDGGSATVILTVRASIEVEGLTIEETFSRGVPVTDLDGAGGQFDTINRSNADWVQLSHDHLTLQPNESREIVLTVATPESYEGTYWCIVHAESRELQVIGEIAGTQIVSRPSVGLKVMATAPGSEELTGRVLSVTVPETAPLTLEARFENTGNVQLVVTAEAEVIDRTGQAVARLPFSEFGRDYFRILPGSTRTIVMDEFPGGDALPSGIYQAVVTFDFGGESLVVGVKGFRVP